MRLTSHSEVIFILKDRREKALNLKGLNIQGTNFQCILSSCGVQNCTVFPCFGEVGRRIGEIAF